MVNLRTRLRGGVRSVRLYLYGDFNYEMSMEKEEGQVSSKKCSAATVP